MSKDKKGFGGKLALGAILAAAAGYIAGLLTAPKSGKETREDIKKKANEVYVNAEKELKKLHTELNERLTVASEKLGELREKGGKKFDDAFEQAKKAKDKVREMLSSLHDGEADDRDLQKAITEATKAVENLRTYLKK
jgi:gas vesicle protein